MGLLPSVGFGEWIILFAVLLVVYGPRRLPELARKLGRLLSQWQRAADQLRLQFMSMTQEEDWERENPYDETGDTSSESVEKPEVKQDDPGNRTDDTTSAGTEAP